MVTMKQRSSDSKANCCKGRRARRSVCEIFLQCRNGREIGRKQILAVSPVRRFRRQENPPDPIQHLSLTTSQHPESFMDGHLDRPWYSDGQASL